MRALLFFFLSIGMVFGQQAVIRGPWTTNVDGKPKNAVAISPTFYSDLSHVTLTIFPAIGQNTDIFRLMDVTNGSIRKVWVDQNYMLWAAGGITGTGGTFTAWSAYAIPGQTDLVWAVYDTNQVLAASVRSNGLFVAKSANVTFLSLLNVDTSAVLISGLGGAATNIPVGTAGQFLLQSAGGPGWSNPSWIAQYGGLGTNTTLYPSNTSSVNLTLPGLTGGSNTLEVAGTNSKSSFGPNGGLHVGNLSAVGGSNIVAEGTITANGGGTNNLGPTSVTNMFNVLGSAFVSTNLTVTNLLTALGNQTNAGWVNVTGGQTNWGTHQVIGQSDLASVTNRGGFTNGGRFLNLSAFQLQTNTPSLTGTGTTNFIIDCSLGNVFNLFPTANFKLWLTNSYSGFQGWINIVQDGSGSRLWIYDSSNIKTNASLILSTPAASVDRIDMRSDTKGTNVQFTLSKAFQ